MESTAAKAATAAPAALGARTLCEAFQITAAERPNEVALRTPGPGVAITYGEYAGRVRRIAGGLASFGVGRGDTVALMLSNRPEFNLVDTAALLDDTGPAETALKSAGAVAPIVPPKLVLRG